jgi:hypothetical protein
MAHDAWLFSQLGTGLLLFHEMEEQRCHRTSTGIASRQNTQKTEKYESPSLACIDSQSFKQPDWAANVEVLWWQNRGCKRHSV